MAWGELLISLRALAPLSNDSGSKPPFDTSPSDFDSGLEVVSFSCAASEGVEDEEEKKGENRKGPSAYAPLEKVEKVEKEAAAAAIAANEDNFDAAIDGDSNYDTVIVSTEDEIGYH